LSFILTLFLPWYTPFIICFLVGIIFSNKRGNNFLAGLLGIGLFWLSYALFQDLKNDHVLSSKIAVLFSESLNTQITSSVLLMVTTFLGALLGGLSTMAGAMIMDDGSRRKRKAVKTGSYKLNL
jgi:Na+/phosphate symporter